MQNISNQIKEWILSKRKGKIFFLNDFGNFGSKNAIRQTLFRLCNENFLVRLSAGIFLYPRVDKYIGIIYPSIEEIAKEIAKREKARLIPTGVYALNALGLSMQMPMRVVFLTDSTPRVINIEGKASIKFKKTIPKYLALRGKIMTLVIFAMKEIGKNQISEEHLLKIKKILAQEDIKNIEHDIKLAPEWIATIISKLLNND
jgi:hypothetical protein